MAAKVVTPGRARSNRRRFSERAPHQNGLLYGFFFERGGVAHGTVASGCFSAASSQNTLTAATAPPKASARRTCVELGRIFVSARAIAEAPRAGVSNSPSTHAFEVGG